MPAINMFLVSGGFLLLAVLVSIIKAIHWLGYPPPSQPKPAKAKAQPKPVEKASGPRYATIQIEESNGATTFFMLYFVISPVVMLTVWLFLWACKEICELLYPF